MDSPTGCTPAVLDGLAFVGTEEGGFLAIDLAKAEVRWRFEAPEPGGVPLVGGRDAAGGPGRLPRQVAVGPGPQERPAALEFPDRGQRGQLAGGRRPRGCSSARPTGGSTAWTSKTGREVWHFEAGGAVIGSPAVAAGRLVIGNDAGRLVLLSEQALMADRLAVVLCEARQADPAQRLPETGLAAALAARPDVELAVLPHLYDLAPAARAWSTCESIPGHFVVLALALSPRGLLGAPRQRHRGPHGPGGVSPRAERKGRLLSGRACPP